MNKKFKKVLLVYKKSAYSIYFLERKIKLSQGERANLQKEVRRFKKAHDEHYATFKHVEQVLKKYDINYTKRFRGGSVNYARYDLIVTIGGDGTFLEASRNVKDQVVIGVNSSLSYSVGKLCMANANNFEKIIRRIVDNKCMVQSWPRIRLNLEGYVRPVDCINDVLVCHRNPAAMSRYYLEIKGIKEEQRSSGVWVSTPAGSSGAVKSAGGRQLKVTEKKIQYAARELYDGFKSRYRLKKGILRAKQSLKITSLMRNGMVFVDGTHFELKFPFNATLKISLSPHPLRTIKL